MVNTYIASSSWKMNAVKGVGGSLSHKGMTKGSQQMPHKGPSLGHQFTHAQRKKKKVKKKK